MFCGGIWVSNSFYLRGCPSKSRLAINKIVFSVVLWCCALFEFNASSIWNRAGVVIVVFRHAKSPVSSWIGSKEVWMRSSTFTIRCKIDLREPYWDLGLNLSFRKWKAKDSTSSNCRLTTRTIYLWISNQARGPAEFKHISKRRKRN